MQLLESGEMYLETILILSQKKANLHAIDVGEYMGYSKPSVSRAVSRLKSGGYITVDEESHIHLTERGLEIARAIYERHTVLSDLLKSLGVDSDVAERDACRIEHAISAESFDAIKRCIEERVDGD